ncbi:MAG: hypothetical protein HDT39_09030 [Lachnospiraceae bacterium]|nr:hypothetical protein [Lachnospiraceae bacterium]
MGRNISKTIIIELNGCCGCGKSTLAAVLGNMFKDKKIRYITLNNLLDRNRTKWYHNLPGKNRELGYKLFRYSCSILPVRFDRMKYFKHVLNIYNAIEQVTEEHEYDIILLDEGILQGLSSIAYQDIICKREVTKQIINLLYKDKEYYVVNCNLDYEELLFRINKRKRNAGRIDQYKEAGELESILKSQYKNLSRLRSLLPKEIEIINLDMKKESMECAKDIYMKMQKAGFDNGRKE